jgi:probable HAF family extracellular repeat protein
MRTSAFQLFTLLFLGCCVGGAQAAPGANASTPPEWRIVDLGTLGVIGPAFPSSDGTTPTTFSSAFGINNAGTVTGGSGSYTPGLKLETYTQHPFAYRNGDMRDLGAVNGTNHAIGRDINNRGQVVGEAGDVDVNDLRAFLYSNGTMTDLGTLGGPRSYAQGINDRGQIVGWSNNDQGRSSGRAFLYENGRMTDIGTLRGANDTPSTDAYAYDINNRGAIVGTSSVGSGPNRHGFVYQDGAMRDLGTLGIGSGANAINERGQIVGFNQFASADYRAYLYQNGTMIDIGTLGGTSSNAYGINELGQVVGWSQAAGNGSSSAFLWQNGTMTDLSLLPAVASAGWRLNDAQDINNAGWITGTGVINGQTHAYMLAPVPEPSTYAMLALGLLALTTVVRRRSK